MSWNIWGHTLAETEDWIVRNGFPRFRAKQIGLFISQICI